MIGMCAKVNLARPENFQELTKYRTEREGASRYAHMNAHMNDWCGLVFGQRVSESNQVSIRRQH
jgi:hypothetical protein